MASEANEDVLYYYQSMKSDNGNQFKEAIAKNRKFEKERIFEIMLLKDKPS